jgi:serine/threonine-protein kinase
MTEQGERFHRLSALFDEVIELDDEAREDRIAERCSDDPTMAEEVRQLLAIDDRGSGEYLVDVIASEAEALTSVDVEGTSLGSWRIIEAIGEGGMGTVYLAERADGAYKAQAAVKLVRGGVPSPMLAERFRAERQILAGLSHPGVAKLLDGGSTDDGTPYLVMEYIDGRPITEWCEERDLDVAGRLRLFLKVCDAVSYAHRELVAHRDLKPSNILVTADGEPKLLDFGIAKLMDAVGDGAEGVTQTYRVMTPAYASPEQVSGERAGVAADTYALGVLLYELLSGRLPLETRGLTPPQLITRVTQDVPPVVSSTVADDARRKRLVGDLDVIVSRALRKEPEARYSSVDSLAEDIRLHLDGRPIRARNDDWRYRTGKLVRRNRGVVSGSVLMLILGISFTVNTIVQSRAVTRERDRAEAQRATAERVSGFLEELFTEVDPNIASARDVTLRDVLDRGAEQVVTGLREEPTSRAALATVIGRVYNALGAYDAARPVLDTAGAVRRALPGGDRAGAADTYLERGALAYHVGAYDEAITWFDSSVVFYREAAAGDSRALAGALGWLGVAHADQGNYEQAEPYSRDAVAMHRRVDPGPNADLAVSLKSLQDVLRDVGRIEEAAEVGVEALAMSREVYGDDHLETAHALNQLASSFRQAGRAQEAIPLVEEGLLVRRAAFDGPHVEIAASLGNLANMLEAVGRQVDALVPRRESVAMLAEIFPPDHPYVAGTTTSLGTVLLRSDSLESAEPVLMDGLRYSRMAFPEGHPNIANALSSLGTLHRRTGRLPSSVEYHVEARDIRGTSLPEGHWNIAASDLELGLTYEAMGRDGEAEQHLTEAYRVLLENFGDDDGRTGRARDALRAHYERRGMSARAAELPAGGA